MIRLREEVVVDDAANLGTKTEEAWHGSLWIGAESESDAAGETLFGYIV